MSPSCPECGAAWSDGHTCQDAFYQMLYWENEYPGYGEVHHLMVLSYHLQHPSLYSQENLGYSVKLMADFLESGKTPQEIRRRDGDQLQSDKRKWKIKGTPEDHGEYAYPFHWRMTAKDVAVVGAENYIQNVREWAKMLLEDIRESGNYPEKS